MPTVDLSVVFLVLAVGALAVISPLGLSHLAERFGYAAQPQAPADGTASFGFVLVECEQGHRARIPMAAGDAQATCPVCRRDFGAERAASVIASLDDSAVWLCPAGHEFTAAGYCPPDLVGDDADDLETRICYRHHAKATLVRPLVRDHRIYRAS